MTPVLIALLMISGIVLLAIEFFLVPGFSVPGIGGIVLIGFGVYKAAMAYGVNGAIIATVAGLAAAGFLIWASLRSRMLSRVGLRKDARGYRAVDDYAILKNQRGITVTPCRPAGIALIGDRRCDVVTDGEYIPADTQVVVTSVEGARIVVAPILPSETPNEAPEAPVHDMEPQAKPGEQ